MTHTTIYLFAILLIMGIVGRYEYRYAKQQARKNVIETILGGRNGH